MFTLFAFFALVGSDDIVKQVIVADQAVVDSRPASQEKVNNIPCGAGCKWIEATTDGSKGKNYPGPEWLYDGQLHAFKTKKPYASWILNPVTAKWEPPLPEPKDGKEYHWNEATQSWDKSK